ncbi:MULTISPECIES: hypothetical protein [unclassified Microbacterium]|uniref:hypothetical protein n=1 Tax=unclassified Microbacterium TaxID=2609290 RepID=UPI00366472CD
MRARRGIAVAAVALLAVLTAGCTAPPDPKAWLLEPVPFAPGGEAPVDVAYAQDQLVPDGAGGFWGASGTTWRHVDAAGTTLAHFNIDISELGARMPLLAPLSTTELLVADRFGARLGIRDNAAGTTRALGSLFPDGRYAPIAAIDSRGRVAYVALLRPATPDAPRTLTLEIVRLDVDDGTRAVLHTEPITILPPNSSDSGPQVRLDVQEDGSILLLTPTGLALLAPDGSVRSRIASDQPMSALALGAGSEVLWWGGSVTGPPSATRASAAPVRVEVRGGSAEARASIERHSTCDDGRTLRLVSTGGGTLQTTARLPFLCDGRAGVWTGSAWIVSIGGEGDGVLVRVTPPRTGG